MEGRGPWRGNSDVIVAVDPGRDKCGIAVVRGDLAVLQREIAPREAAVARVSELARAHGACAVVLGDRTASKALARDLEANTPGLEFAFIDEHMSSVEGRRRYLLDHPLPGLLGRLVPVSLRTPREPFDDYVAVVLAERFFHHGKT